MKKHVKWTLNKAALSGLVAVKLDENNRIEVRSIHGKCLPAELLFPVLNSTLQGGWIEEAERLHQSRKNPWRVEQRRGMSGCYDFVLYYLKNENLLDQPLAAKIHISMSSYLNRGIHCWLGDLPPLLAEIMLEFPPPAADEYSVIVYTPQIRGDYRHPGARSGLKTVLVEQVPPALPSIDAPLDAWHEAGWRDPAGVRSWYGAGWRDAKAALAWYKAGWIIPQVALRCHLAGWVEPDKAGVWYEAGWRDAKAAFAWYISAWGYYDPQTALLWYNAGWRDPDTARAWHEAGWDDPSVAGFWHEAGWRDAKIARNWYNAGWRDAKGALLWYEAGWTYPKVALRFYNAGWTDPKGALARHQAE